MKVRWESRKKDKEDIVEKMIDERKGCGSMR